MVRSLHVVPLLVLAAAAMPAPTAQAKRLAAPKPQSPDAGAVVQGIPAFTWGKVAKADAYEFQLSADPRFGSIVGGQGSGASKTRNTAATVSKSLADGEYFWRVRAITASARAGRWSPARSFEKRWSARPEPVSPVRGAAVVHPSTPLLFRWSPAVRAYKYRLYVATDPGLGTLVLKSSGGPIETSGTVYAPGVTLRPGRYYWAVEAVDSAGHRGVRSEVASFEWSWPTVTSTGWEDLVADLRLADPLFKWDPVPGAVAYELEVNFSVDFAAGSKVCCSGPIVGTAYSPRTILPNNVYYWRVRAIDATGATGRWNVGEPVDKNFGNVPPTVQSLTLRDDDPGDGLNDVVPGGGIDTMAPVVTWDPVPGAASYELQAAPWETLGNGQQACNWTSATVWSARTAATAWTPLAGSATAAPGGLPSPATDGSRALVDGRTYCLRVRAWSGNPTVGSDWTQLGGQGVPAFTYRGHAANGDALLRMGPGDYREPQTGTTTPRLPLFTWKRIESAGSYWVVVSKDQAFTNITDVALTRVPAYAPRAGSAPRTYADETTPYYWAVIPAAQANGGGVATEPGENGPCTADTPLPCRFVKRSTPPRLLSPAEGASVTDQPVFRWASGETDATAPAGARATPEGAKEYRLQVAQDPSFGDPIDDVVTQALSYTSTASYPADTVLYWRVRVNDANGIGLTWSAPGTFRRRLAVPKLTPGNPTDGAAIPAFTWEPVIGASSYDFHVDQADGTRKDFTVAGTAFAPTTFYGTGIWRWQVRANFPSGSSKVSSGYTAPQGFARRIPAPEGMHAVVRNGRVLLAWEPGVNAKEYKVDFSTVNSFSSIALSARTQNPAYAPTGLERAFLDGGRIYWRVASIDEGGNVGGYATGVLKTARRMALSVSGSVVRSQRSKVTVTLRDAGGRPVRRARVKVRGAAGRASRRTGRRGTAVFALRARRKGTVTFRATRRGYRPALAVATVG